MCARLWSLRALEPLDGLSDDTIDGVGLSAGATGGWRQPPLGTLTGTVNGDTTIGGKTIDSWGKTRFNTNFTTEMIQPWESNTTCGWWCPTQGNYSSVTDSFTVTALLGVNSAGTQVTSGCAYGLKLNWTLQPGNYTGEAIVQYW